MKNLPGKFFTLVTTLTIAITLSGHTALAEGKDTDLAKQMKIISKSIKQLKNQIADPAQQQSSITLVESAKQAAAEAKKLTPAHAADIPEADRPKFITDYQAQMDKLIQDFTDIDTDLHTGKYDDAQKTFADLGGVKKDGHKEFIKPE
jgi:soluble cytochrome b562